MVQRGYRQSRFLEHVDWVAILLYTILVFMGWISIYAAVYDESHSSILDFSQRYGKQLVWITVAFIFGFSILLIDSKFFTFFAIPIYILMMLSLLAVLKLGVEVNGARSWFQVGSLRIQPAEFAKIATCLMVAKVMSKQGFKIMKPLNLLLVGTILAIPALLIIIQNDTGSALVYASFIMVMYREGLAQSIPIMLGILVFVFVFTLLYSSTAIIAIIICGAIVAIMYYRQNLTETITTVLIIGALFAGIYGTIYALGLDIDSSVSLLVTYLIATIAAIVYYKRKHIKKIIPILLLSWATIGCSYGVNFAFSHLKEHQQMRIKVTLGIESDPSGYGYNVNQSQIAIGSGGFSGKGFLQGTQTKYNFVPEQDTDFIFCTVGEEWGFIGSSLVIILIVALIIRIIVLAERQRSAFSRIYGLGVAGILLFHLIINIGMVIGLTPVIGIPLPFFSYGGSSLWTFTILIFIFLKLDSNRMQAL